MNNTLALPLAALPEHPELAETISFQLSGLVVVFLVLGSIWFLLEIIGKIFAFRTKQPAKTTTIVCPGTPATAAAANAPASAPDTAITTETVALIAAAVHLSVGPRHRILSIAPVAPNPHWALEGRRQIFASHRPR